MISTSRSEQDSLISTVAAFSGDICMSFGVNKCCVASLHQGRLVESSDIVLPCGDSIYSLKTEKSYRYLGILESGSIQHQTMKQHITREYRRWVTKILSTQLYGKYTVQAINSLQCGILQDLSIGLRKNCINWMLELEN